MHRKTSTSRTMLCRTYLLLLSASLGMTLASSIQPRQSVIPPPECNVIPAWEMTDFLWFNSSHNLDCVYETNVPDVCFNSTPSGALIACDSNLTPCLECGVYGCDTGLPLQPAGFGPPDSITLAINVTHYNGCVETNPQSIRRHDVGDGFVLCNAGVAFYVTFVGDSNSAVSRGHIDFAPQTSYACSNGSTILGTGSVDFEIDCAYDEGGNATCLVPGGEGVLIPLLGYAID